MDSLSINGKNCVTKGILRLERGNDDLAKLIRFGSGDLSRYVIIQEFLPDVGGGDKRIFLLDGNYIVILL